MHVPGDRSQMARLQLAHKEQEDQAVAAAVARVDDWWPDPRSVGVAVIAGAIEKKLWQVRPP